MDARARAFVIIGAVVALVGAGALGYWLGDRPEGTTPLDRVVGVTRAVNVDGTAIALDGLPDRFRSDAFDVSGAEGRGCLVPLATGQRVEVGVIHTRPDPDVPGTYVVAWLDCLSRPTERNRR